MNRVPWALAGLAVGIGCGVQASHCEPPPTAPRDAVWVVKDSSRPDLVGATLETIRQASGGALLFLRIEDPDDGLVEVRYDWDR